MKNALCVVYAVVLLATVGVAIAPAQIDPGAGDWVLTENIGPFTFMGRAKFLVGKGSGAASSDLFGADPRTIEATTEYADWGRHLGVGVSVSREVDTTYVDHMMTLYFHDNDTGHLGAGASIISLFGHATYFLCHDAPDCTYRTYAWRTDSHVVVEVRASGFDPATQPDWTPGVKDEDIGKPPRYYPTLEPTEVLQAYLQRYPSALTMFQDTEEHAHQWLLDEAALSLAAAEYKLAELDRGGHPEQITQHLLDFARMRALSTGGVQALFVPSASRERERLDAIDRMGGAKQVEAWKALAKEYHDWWNSHVGQPIYVPSPPPPTAAPTAPPVTPSVAPTP